MIVQLRAKQDLNYPFFSLPLLSLLFEKFTLICGLRSPYMRNPDSGIQRIFAFGIWNPGNFLLVESTILGFGIRNTSHGIRNPKFLNDWNPESSAWNPESSAWSRIQDHLECPYMHGASASLLGNGKPGLQGNPHITHPYITKSSV